MSTLLVEEFGRISVSYAPVDLDYVEDLWSIFLARSLHMGWTVLPNQVSLLWNMHEAELTPEADQPRIGWAQVGLDVGPVVFGSLDPSTQIDADAQVRGSPDPGSDKGDLTEPRWAALPTVYEAPCIDPSVAIPPLIQCVDDSIRWFGETELSALQVTATYTSQTTRPYEFNFTSVHSWFNTQSSKPKTPAMLTFAAERWDDRMAAAVAEEMRQWSGDSFGFDGLTVVPDGLIPRPEIKFIEWSSAASNLGVPVVMSEWDVSSIGWVIALAFKFVLSLDPAPQHLAVRVSRLDL